MAGTIGQITFAGSGSVSDAFAAHVGYDSQQNLEQNVPLVVGTGYNFYADLASITAEYNLDGGTISLSIGGNGVALHPFGMAVLRTIQFHGQLCVRAVEIQDVIPGGVLPTEFEIGKTPATQRPLQCLLVVRLVVTQLTGDSFEAHQGMMFVVGKIINPSPARSPSPHQMRGLG